MSMWRFEMSGEHPELDDLQATYKEAVEAWISSIRNEEDSLRKSFFDRIDKWEQAHLDEDEMRNSVKAAKAKYEDALGAKFLRFLVKRPFFDWPDTRAQFCHKTIIFCHKIIM